MSLKSSLRRVFANEEGLYDLSTTDMDKTIEFAKGDFKRFYGGGPVQYGNTSAYYKPAPSIPTETSDYTSYAAQKVNLQKPTGFLGTPDNVSSAYYRPPAPKAPRTLQGSNVSSGYYKTDFGRKTPSFMSNQSTSWRDRLSSWADKVDLTEKVDKFIQNLRDYYQKTKEKGGYGTPEMPAPSPLQPSRVGARGVAGATFKKGQISNSAITSEMARFFDPKLNSEFAKFLMANMGTSNVNTKGLPLFTDKIAARRTRYTSGVVTPQEVTFNLPTRTT